MTAKMMERSVDLNDKLEINVMMMLVTNTTVNTSRVDESKWVTYACTPWSTPKLTKKKIDPNDQSKANLRGFSESTGKRKMQMA